MLVGHLPQGSMHPNILTPEFISLFQLHKSGDRLGAPAFPALRRNPDHE